MIELLLLLVLLQFKHLFIDFINQSEAEIEGKGILFDYYGISHSLKHAFFSFICLAVCAFIFKEGYANKLHGIYVILLFGLEFLLHYAIDYSKQNITKLLEYTPAKKGFWVALGIDQMLHQLTYLLIVFLLLRLYSNA